MNDTPQHLSGQPTAPTASGATVECRPNRDRQAAIIFVLACGWLLPVLCLFIPTTPGRKPLGLTTAFLAMGTIFFLLAAFLNWFAGCYYIKADEHGLAWQSQLKRRFARWNQIEDYYERRMEGGTTRHLVRTQSGTLTFTDRNGLTNIAELREAIVNRARWSQAWQWQVKNTRLEPGQTLVFRYDLSSLKRDILFTAFLCLLIGPLAMLKGGTRNVSQAPSAIAQIWSQLSWPMALGLVFTLLLVFVLPLALYVTAPVSRYQQAKARSDEFIEVDTQGITFTRGATQIRAAWNEVTDYYSTNTTGWFQSRERCVVITRRGTFDFTQISNKTQLREIIRRYATATETKKWRYHEEDTAPTNNAYNPRGTSDEQRFTYRTRDTRALLLLPTIIAVIMFAGPSLAVGQIHPGSLIIFVAAMMLCAWGWWHYYFSSIVVDKTGISQWRGRGKRYIAWQEVKDYYRSSFYDIIEGENTRISFFPMVTGGERLHQLIQRHAGCGRKEWVQH